MFDPNEDVTLLDCDHYDQESKAYPFGEKSLICDKCFSRHEVAEQLQSALDRIDNILVEHKKKEIKEQQNYSRCNKPGIYNNEITGENCILLDGHDEDHIFSIREQAVRAILDPFTLGLRLCGGKK